MSAELNEIPDEGQNIRAVGYVRVSEEADNSEQSVATQQDRIQQAADERNILVVDWHIDRGFGGNSMDRPALRTLLDAAESAGKPFDLVLVWDLSRLSRSQEDFMEILSRLRASGVDVTSVTES